MLVSLCLVLVSPYPLVVIPYPALVSTCLVLVIPTPYPVLVYRYF